MDLRSSIQLIMVYSMLTLNLIASTPGIPSSQEDDEICLDITCEAHTNDLPPTEPNNQWPVSTTPSPAEEDDELISNPKYNNSVSPSKYPGIVDVMVRSPPGHWATSDTTFQTGVIISANFVLAPQVNCDVCNYTVLVGSDGQGRGGVQYMTELIPFVSNENSSLPSDENKLALLKTLNPIEFGVQAQVIKLKQEGVKPGDKGVTVGSSLTVNYRRTNSRYLECDRVVITEQKYDEYMKDFFKYSREFTGLFPATSIPKITCSGGNQPALFIQDHVAGIRASKSIIVFEDHGEYGSIDVERYHDVAYYRDWIKNVTGI